jgi:hypothetical protein
MLACYFVRQKFFCYLCHSFIGPKHSPTRLQTGLPAPYRRGASVRAWKNKKIPRTPFSSLSLDVPSLFQSLPLLPSLAPVSPPSPYSFLYSDSPCSFPPSSPSGIGWTGFCPTRGVSCVRWMFPTATMISSFKCAVYNLTTDLLHAKI